MSKALDYSAGIPPGTAVRAAGYVGVIRYLTKRNPSGVHVLSKAEYDDMTAHGIGVALVYEDTDPGRTGQGHAAGVTDATWALEQARSCGIDPRCIYFATDYDAAVESVQPYYQGTESVLGKARNGAYGSAAVVSGLHAAGLISWLWQTQAWSAGAIADGIHLYQRIGTVTVGGVACDVNDIHAPDFGQHPPMATTTTTEPTGDVLDMDEKQLSDLIDQRLKVAFGNDYAGADLAKVVAAGPVSTRSATKVRDMDHGTEGIEVHVLSGGEKLQLICDHLGIKIPGASE